MRRAVAAPEVFPPLQRVAIEGVACTAPHAFGVHVSRWDGRTVQQVVVEHALVDSLHSTTVARMLAQASTPPQDLCRVEALEFGAGVVRGEAPLDRGFGSVPVSFPRRDFLLHGLPSGQPPLETLAG